MEMITENSEFMDFIEHKNAEEVLNSATQNVQWLEEQLNILPFINFLFILFTIGFVCIYAFLHYQEETEKELSTLKVKKLDPKALLPLKSSANAAGYDLTSLNAEIVRANDKQLVETGLAITVPDGTYGRIAPRSGLALKHGIAVGGGVVDQDYTGPVNVILYNHSNKDFTIAAGDRIAQLVIEKIAHPEIIEVSDLSATSRGESGFGSTGVASQPSQATKSS